MVSCIQPLKSKGIIAMSDIMNEIKDELINHIDSLRDFFEDYDFNTPQGHSKVDIDGIHGFELIAVKDEVPLSFHDFKKNIKCDFHSNDDDVKTSEFDWDELENLYEEVAFKYNSYKALYIEIEDNLTGDQTVDSVELMDKDDVMERLLDYMIQEGLIYEVNHAEKGILYIPNAKIENKLGK